MAGVVSDAIGARNRIWTENLGPALFVLSFAILGAFLPAIVSMIELMFAKNKTGYLSLTDSMEEFFLGTLALCMSASLNYFESHYELNLGKACGVLAGFSTFSGFLALVGYFIVHFIGKDIFNVQYDSGWFALLSMSFVGTSIFASALTIMQGRRMRDKLR